MERISTPERRKAAGEIDDPGLVGDAQQSAFNARHESIIMVYSGASDYAYSRS